MIPTHSYYRFVLISFKIVREYGLFSDKIHWKLISRKKLKNYNFQGYNMPKEQFLGPMPDA